LIEAPQPVDISEYTQEEACQQPDREKDGRVPRSV
jgi:hypothetical protein